MVRMKLVAILALTVAVVTTLPAAAEKVGEVGVDWLGSDIIVEASRTQRSKASPAM